MIRTMLKSKIHRAKITQTDINYNGSVTIDRALCEKADILENERVDIYNINNGERFSTYVIYGKKGMIGINGAAARLAQKGDLIIVVSYAQLDEEKAKKHKPVIISL
ncbi:MAG: aspartate 1-decarboxylase [Elusimicrobia bacterium]|nr:aspartate 1-decarboxylase [Elusimicrobiota bacterium]